MNYTLTEKDNYGFLFKENDHLGEWNHEYLLTNLQIVFSHIFFPLYPTLSYKSIMNPWIRQNVIQNFLLKSTFSFLCVLFPTCGGKTLLGWSYCTLSGTVKFWLLILVFLFEGLHKNTFCLRKSLLFYQAESFFYLCLLLLLFSTVYIIKYVLWLPKTISKS